MQKVFKRLNNHKKLEVGKWFLIDLDHIDFEMLNLEEKCKHFGIKGTDFYNAVDTAYKFARNKYSTNKIETIIFKKNWDWITEEELREKCSFLGDRQINEHIAFLELAMRVINGEELDNLIIEPDTLPRVRIITLEDGGTGYLGGGYLDDNDYPPADLRRLSFCPSCRYRNGTTSAFRLVH